MSLPEYKVRPLISDRGVNDFVGEDNYTSSFGYQWNKFSTTQLDSQSGLDLSERRLRESLNFESLDRLKGLTILEVGSGCGRFTEILVKYGALFESVDFSNAIYANARNNGHQNARFSRASIYDLPFEPESFDIVLCLGVIQHTPDPVHAIECLARQVKPGGLLCIDAYRKTLLDLLQWKYILRPLTKRIAPRPLIVGVSVVCRILIPIVKLSKRLLGVWSGRLFPIREYSEFIKNSRQNLEWSVLDTFDTLSPEYDKPMSIWQLTNWTGIQRFAIEYCGRGSNGYLFRAKREIEEVRSSSSDMLNGKHEH